MEFLSLVTLIKSTIWDNFEEYMRNFEEQQRQINNNQGIQDFEEQEEDSPIFWVDFDPEENPNEIILHYIVPTSVALDAEDKDQESVQEIDFEENSLPQVQTDSTLGKKTENNINFCENSTPSGAALCEKEKENSSLIW